MPHAGIFLLPSYGIGINPTTLVVGFDNE